MIKFDLAKSVDQCVGYFGSMTCARPQKAKSETVKVSITYSSFVAFFLHQNVVLI
jgi:hypothetical protein